MAISRQSLFKDSSCSWSSVRCLYWYSWASNQSLLQARCRQCQSQPHQSAQTNPLGCTATAHKEPTVPTLCVLMERSTTAQTEIYACRRLLVLSRVVHNQAHAPTSRKDSTAMGHLCLPQAGVTSTSFAQVLRSFVAQPQRPNVFRMAILSSANSSAGNLLSDSVVQLSLNIAVLQVTSLDITVGRGFSLTTKFCQLSIIFS